MLKLRPILQIRQYVIRKGRYHGLLDKWYFFVLLLCSQLANAACSGSVAGVQLALARGASINCEITAAGTVRQLRLGDRSDRD